MTLDQYFSSCYDDLRVVAERCLAGPVGGDEREPPDLISEVYTDFARKAPSGFKDRGDFIRIAGRAFRYHVYRNWCPGRWRRVPLQVCTYESSHPLMLALVMAFESLELLHPRAARVVDLHLVGGLGVRETARELGVSQRTVVRDTRLARAFLKREMIRHLDMPSRLPA